MDKIKIILAPTDLSEPSQAAVRYALNLARALGAEVTVYHVVNNEELVHYFEELEEGEITDITFRQANRLLKSYQLALARFLNEHFSDLIPWVRIREKVEWGVPEKSIVEWAEKEGSDLIVISFHERSDQTQASVGIVAEKIVRNAPCPVLSVHSRLEEKPGQKAAAVA
ncbi:MAG: universal stress protein [Candidatus Binatota bacterium]